MTEGLDESQQGYPEEQPEGTDPSGDPPSEESPQRRGGKAAHDEDHDDGKATGNPHYAG